MGGIYFRINKIPLSYRVLVRSASETAPPKIFESKLGLEF